MAKKKNNKGAIALKKIRTRAKAIVSTTGKGYQAALKQAGHEYRSGSTPKQKTKKKSRSSVKKKSPTRSPGKKVGPRKVVHGTISTHLAAAKSLIGDHIAKLEIRRSNTTGKRERKSIQKEISTQRKKLSNPFS